MAHQALLAERHKLLVLKDQYASALRRYTAALPIENVRLQLLKDAGEAGAGDRCDMLYAAVHAVHRRHAHHVQFALPTTRHPVTHL